MIRESVALIVFAMAAGGFVACSDDDSADGGSGGSSGSRGSDAGSSGSGGATEDAGGGSGQDAGGDARQDAGGDGADPIAACVADRRPVENYPSCRQCECETCLDELQVCGDDEACAAMGDCVEETNCTGVDCYLPETCQEVFDENGGPFGPSVDLLTAAGACTVAACEEECGRVAAGEPILGTITVWSTAAPTDAGTFGPVEGAEVCIHDTTDCVTTDSDGEATIDLPGASEVALLITADDHATMLKGAVTARAPQLLNAYLTTTSEIEAHASAAGVTLDDTKGTIQFTISGPGGARGNLSPDSGTLVYYDADGNPDPSLTESVEGTPRTAAIWNVDPGEYELSFSHADTACARTQLGSWEGSEPGTARVLVVAGAVSSGGHAGLCEPLP